MTLDEQFKFCLIRSKTSVDQELYERFIRLHLKGQSRSTRAMAPLCCASGFAMTYPLDSDLSGGKRYPSFEQLGPGVQVVFNQSLETDVAMM